MSAVRKVLVVGGGIGGLSTAIALRRAGIDVQVIEIDRDWKIYQVGIVVQANFIRAMAQLGIADQAIAAGFAYDGLSFQGPAWPCDEAPATGRDRRSQLPLASGHDAPRAA
jgi:2-polyprenyl-6-methoxyphenol hydroxylase-like FAD-dependent oxidoreductase